MTFPLREMQAQCSYGIQAHSHGLGQDKARTFVPTDTAAVDMYADVQLPLCS
jgi:hypothetical protein